MDSLGHLVGLFGSVYLKSNCCSSFQFWVLAVMSLEENILINGGQTVCKLFWNYSQELQQIEAVDQKQHNLSLKLPGVRSKFITKFI